jgi:hypothetical protein
MSGAESVSPSGLGAPLAELLAFLRAGRHLMPGGGVRTLRELRKALPGVPVVGLLRDHFPSTNAAVRAASMTRMRAGGAR